MATPPKPSPPAKADAAPAPPPKQSGKLMLIISLAVLVLAGGSGGAWYFFGKGAHEGPVQAKAKATMFLPLDVFTVNLISKEALPQYLQTAITLKLTEDYAGLVKTRMPEVRNRVLLVLSSKSVKELLSPDGKTKLALEIADAVKTMIALPGAAPAQPAPGASMMGEAQAAAVGEAPAAAAADAQPATAGDAKTDQTAQTAEGAADAEPAAKPVARARPASASNIEVLFTSFIIQ